MVATPRFRQRAGSRIGAECFVWSKPSFGLCRPRCDATFPLGSRRSWPSSCNSASSAAIGFVADTAVVYALRAPAGLYVAGTAAYGVAVTVTWWVNRIWTFRGISNIGPMRRQWAYYAIANLPGLLLNLGTYFALVAGSPFCAAYPVIAVAAGAGAGMFANFTLSRALVFR